MLLAIFVLVFCPCALFLQIKLLNPCREGKKLLVLDIDYTLFDHRSSAENPLELMRPCKFIILMHKKLLLFVISVLLPYKFPLQIFTSFSLLFTQSMISSYGPQLGGIYYPYFSRKLINPLIVELMSNYCSVNLL